MLIRLNVGCGAVGLWGCGRGAGPMGGCHGARLTGGRHGAGPTGGCHGAGPMSSPVSLTSYVKFEN